MSYFNLPIWTQKGFHFKYSSSEWFWSIICYSNLPFNSVEWIKGRWKQELHISFKHLNITIILWRKKLNYLRVNFTVVLPCIPSPTPLLFQVEDLRHEKEAFPWSRIRSCIISTVSLWMRPGIHLTSYKTLYNLQHGENSISGGVVAL